MQAGAPPQSVLPFTFCRGCGVEAGRGKSTKVRKGMDDAWRRSKQKEEEGG